ncbi:MAG: ATP synthase subunit I [Betaproteobacteria bacterium]|nr:MAG: ATP synthase subunit I [Betaproteobacteria bacterium]
MIRGLLSILGLQLLVAGCVTLAFLLASGPMAAKSAAIGGAIAFIPGAFYAWRLIVSRNANPSRLLRTHFVAEVGKLTLTFVLFAVTFVWIKDVSAITLFVAYIAVLLVYWLALILFKIR